MKKIKITEEQYNAALAEGVTLTADLDAANGNVAKAVDTARNQARKSGINLDNVRIEVPAKTESKIKLKKQLDEERLNKMKRDSIYYTVDDFIKKCYKK